MRGKKTDKELYYNTYLPPYTSWDKTLDLSKQTSMYYAICAEKFGQSEADHYWNRRESLDGKHDIINWQKECRDIMKKCNEFLKSRGVLMESNYNGQKTEEELKKWLN